MWIFQSLGTKTWKCLRCGHVFTTEWKPFFLVRCPMCGSGAVVRVDVLRGRGFGPRYGRGVCET